MRPRWSTSTDRLVHYIAHNCQPSLQSELGAWLQSRPRSAAEPLALASVVATKVRQLPTGVPNGLVIAGRDLSTTPDLLAAAVKQLKARAASKDDLFFTRRGLRDVRDFNAHFLRLS